MRDPSKYTVEALKELLKKRNLPTSGTKSELISRLMEDDPSGEWLRSNDEEFRDWRGDAESIPQAGFSSTQSMDARRMEIELYRREKEVAERELELARREIEMMRNQLRECAIINENSNGNITRIRSVQPKVNITAIADLLSHFDGKSVNYNTWENQIRLLKTTYQLEDDAARLLIGMRLKGKALEWLHSKPEYVAMPFDVLLGELRAMFQHRQSRVTTRKIFEERGKRTRRSTSTSMKKSLWEIEFQSTVTRYWSTLSMPYLTTHSGIRRVSRNSRPWMCF